MKYVMIIMIIATHDKVLKNGMVDSQVDLANCAQYRE